NVFMVINFFIIIFITITGSWIINLLYGQEYYDSSIILKILIWSGIFVFMRAMLNRYLIIEYCFKFQFFSELIGATINVCLNFIFIPFYSGIGAAYATLISYAVPVIVVPLFYRRTRGISIMMYKSFIPIFTLENLKRKD